MRFIYIDEAGTSANEPVSVVVGIIVDADRQWRTSEAALQEVVTRMVPRHFSENFISHATEVWGSKKYRDAWSREERTAFLCEIMTIPRRLNLGISLAYQRRGALDWGDAGKLSQSEVDHVMAFSKAVSMADHFIRKYGTTGEIGAAVAEDLPELRKFLRLTLDVQRQAGITLGPDLLRRTRAQEALGILPRSFDSRVRTIVDPVHFVDKGASPMLQVADAIAFGFRRYFAKQSEGELFLNSILGGSFVEPEIWNTGAGSMACFRFHGAPKFTGRPEMADQYWQSLGLFPATSRRY